jgi:hypothetical protein
MTQTRRRVGERYGILAVVKHVAFLIGVVLFALASACLAVFGASSVLGKRPVAASFLGSIVTLGLAAPPIARRFADRARLRALSAQELLRWHADSIREQIVSAEVGLTLRDVGVHVFVKTRRNWPPWRHEYLRIARSAWSSRSPEPRHAVWPEHWRTGMADGLVGFAAHERARLQVDLMDVEHQRASEAVWNEWYVSRDARSLGVPYESSANIRKWFSVMWAEPIPAARGDVLGVITLNVEREVPDGSDRLRAAQSAEIMRVAARSAGLALTSVRL